MLPYEKQLFYKQKQVVDNFERIGRLDLNAVEVVPILAASRSEFYRNKLEFTFSNNRWYTKEELAETESITDWNALGFHVPKMFDKIIDIRKCHLQDDPSNEIRLFLRQYATDHQLTFHNPRTHRGYLRNVIIRTASTGDLMVILIVNSDEPEVLNPLLSALKVAVPQITSLMYVINSKFNDSIQDLDVSHFEGKDHLIERMEDLQFKVGPKSFYQTNSEQAYRLYCIAREFAGLTGSEVVYDLYTGTGTIANFVAAKAAKVVGVEYVPEAIEDAKVNSALNGIENTLFFAGDMKDVFTHDFIRANGKPDVIILDPPRAGIHTDVVKGLLFAAPQRIVYVSCNPATQARDIELLGEMYRLEKLQPVDMFPHTHHVENVALLVKK
jgi:23S rRNA (uracil1939-C5)-methyltransferase